MSNFELLDDALVYQDLETDIVLIHAKKIAFRVLILALFFGIFSSFCVLVTIEAWSKVSNGGTDYYFLVAALCTQIGTAFLTIRLFLYQWRIRKKQDWAMIFEAKYKVWRALAIVFAMTLLSVTLLVLDANEFI